MANCSCPDLRLLLTCEHAVNAVPPQYWYLFAGHETVLRTHRGYDQYALAVAKELARAFVAPLHAATVTRLLVDANRTPASRTLFSSYARPLGRKERELVRATWHTPHQEAVSDTAARIIVQGGRVLHIAIHTFTPVLHGQVRTADLGLLYDPGRPEERALCTRWLAELRRAAPDLRLRRNYPYLGKSNSLPTLLRTRFPGHDYLGIEVEINQGTAVALGLDVIGGALIASLDRVLPGLIPYDEK